METYTNKTDSASTMTDSKSNNNESNSKYQDNLHNLLAGITPDELTGAFDRINAIYEAEGGAAVGADRLRIAEKFPAFNFIMKADYERMLTDVNELTVATGLGFAAYWLALIAEHRLSRNLEQALIGIDPVELFDCTWSFPEEIVSIYKGHTEFFTTKYKMLRIMPGIPFPREMVEGFFLGAPWDKVNIKEVRYWIAMFAISVLCIAERYRPVSAATDLNNSNSLVAHWLANPDSLANLKERIGGGWTVKVGNKYFCFSSEDVANASIARVGGVMVPQ